MLHFSGKKTIFFLTLLMHHTALEKYCQVKYVSCDATKYNAKRATIEAFLEKYNVNLISNSQSFPPFDR